MQVDRISPRPAVKRRKTRRGAALSLNGRGWRTARRARDGGGAHELRIRLGGSSLAGIEGFCEIDGRIFDVVTHCATPNW